MDSSSKWTSWIVLLCAALLPAFAARCLGEDPPLIINNPQAIVDVRPAPAAAENAAAETNVPQTAAEYESLLNAIQAMEAPPKPEHGSLLNAIMEALGESDNLNAAAPANGLAKGDPNVRAMEAQLKPEIQQVLYVELAYLRRICKPDAKSFAVIAKTARAGLGAPLHEYAVATCKLQQGGVVTEGSVDPRLGIEKLLASIVEANLGAAKARLYRDECAKRKEAAKHAVVANLVATLDEKLALSADQRAKLVQSISNHYEESWDQGLSMIMVGRQSGDLPVNVDKATAPLLDEKQKDVLKQAQEQGFETTDSTTVFDASGEPAELQDIAGIAEEPKHDH